MELMLKRKVIFICLMVAFMFALFEFVGFIYVKVFSKPIGSYGYPTGLYKPDNRLDFRLTPNFRGHFERTLYKDIAIETNSLGWREREFSLSPSPETFRVCVLGDSVTFGSGVNVNVRFSQVLENILNNDTLDASVEVINLAVNSHTTYHYLELIKKEVKEYQCNHVVIGFCINDIWPKETSFPRTRVGLTCYAPRSNGTVEDVKKRPLLVRISRQSYFLTMAKRLMAMFGVKDVGRYSADMMHSLEKWWRDENDVRILEDLLREIKDTLAQSQIGLTVIALPQRNDVDQPEFFGYSWLRLLNLLEDLGIEAIDLHPAFRVYGNSRELFLTGDSLHLSAKGNELVGKTVASILKGRLQSEMSSYAR